MRCSSQLIDSGTSAKPRQPQHGHLQPGFLTTHSGRTVQYKLNAQSLRLFGLHSDVNDAHRAGANRLQKNKTLILCETQLFLSTDSSPLYVKLQEI